MKYLKILKKELRNEKVDLKDYLRELFENFRKYKKNNLGAKLYKVRVARKGQGKSGGYRNIVFWQYNKFVIAVYVFAKADKDNLSNEEFDYLKILARQYEKFTDESLNRAVSKDILREIDHE